MAVNIGLNVIEKPTDQAPFIPSAEFTNLALLIRSARGPLEPIRISSPVNADKILGEIRQDMNGILGIQRAYLNAKPYSFNTYGLRVVGPGTNVASKLVDVGSIKFVLAPSNVTVTCTGIVIATTANPDVFTVTITGTVNAVSTTEVYTVKSDEAVAAINFGAGSFTQSAMVRILYMGESLIAGTYGAVNAISGRIIGGTETTPEVPAVAAVTGNLAIALGTVGDVFVVNVAGSPVGAFTRTVTESTTTLLAAAIAAAINIDGYTGTNSTGNVIVHSTTDRGATSNGVAVTIVNTTASVTVSGSFSGGVTYVPPVISYTQYTLKAARFGKLDPGKWANDYGFSVEVDGSKPMERSFTVYKRVNGEWIRQEIITGITAKNQVTKLTKESSYAGLFGSIPIPTKLMIPTSTIIQFSGGTDESAAPSVTDFINALSGFGGVPFSFLTTTESFNNDDTIKLAKGIDLYLEANRPTALGGVNFDATVDQLYSIGVQALLRQKSYIACYMGYETIDDGFNGTRKIPALLAGYGRGFIKKMFDKPSKLPHEAPAGYPTALLGTYEVSTEFMDETTLTYLVKELGVNPIQLKEGVGWILRTSRTMSTDNRFYDIHKRRSVNFIADSFKLGLGWLEQEPHTEETWKKLSTAIRLFTNDLYNKGMFHTDGGFEGAVAIKVDHENNPPAQVAQRLLVCETTVWIVDTIESAEIVIKSSDRGPLDVSIN